MKERAKDELWVLCDNNGYEGFGSPLGLFKSYESAVRFALERDNERVPEKFHRSYDDFLKYDLYINYYLELVKIHK